MRYLLIIIGLQFPFHLFAQKKPLDLSVPAKWPTLIPHKISNDGKFVIYTSGSSNAGYVLVAQSTDNPWKAEIPIGPYSRIETMLTEDSRWLIFAKSPDSLGVLALGSGDLKYLDKVANYKMPKGGGACLAYQAKDDSMHGLILYNLEKGTFNKYPRIADYLFSNNGQVILMQQYSQAMRDPVDHTVTWINLPDGDPVVISKGFKASNFSFDEAGSRLVFFAEADKNKQIPKNELYYYKSGMAGAKALIDLSTEDMTGLQPVSGGSVSLPKSKYALGTLDLPFISKDGKKLYFFMQRLPSPVQSRVADTLVGVDVFNYKDQSPTQFTSENFLAVINLEGDRKVLPLGKETDFSYTLTPGGNGDWVVADGDIEGDYRDKNWRISARPNVYLISTKDGSRKLIKSRLIYDCLGFSPSGKYMIWYSKIDSQWVSYNTRNGTSKEFSRRAHVRFNSDGDHLYSAPEGIAGWLKYDQGVLIYDKYDIWKLDPDGEHAPLNITGGFGRQHHIVLRCPDFRQDIGVQVSLEDTLLFSAFNTVTKEAGFFRQRLGIKGKPELLTMGSWFWYFCPGNAELAETVYYAEQPMRARFADTYVLRRMTPSTYPNLYLTHDFKDFKPLTDLTPQKEYNWYISELIHWTKLDGQKGEGILYKPEDFDPKKKYPVIFYYYEKNADQLNFFITPELCRGILSIPWFVSNGYLVCVPDIIYEIGHPGESAYNSVVGAAMYLSKKPWVNAKKMGLQGHSFGGFETNYIVTRTHLFAAAAPAAGPSNFVSEYTSIEGDNFTMYGFFEEGQGRVGSSLWKNPGLYIENSPIFKADKVTTPILILHNKKDPAVEYIPQGLPWYLALQHLGKKVWMLQYDKESHSLHNPKARLDYSIRLGQFFGHYLKGDPAPKWMTQGVSVSRKGMDSGLELDTTGTQP